MMTRANLPPLKTRLNKRFISNTKKKKPRTTSKKVHLTDFYISFSSLSTMQVTVMTDHRGINLKDVDMQSDIFNGLKFGARAFIPLENTL